MRRYEKCSRSAIAFMVLISTAATAAAITPTPAHAAGVTGSTPTTPRTAADPDEEFLKKLRAAGFPETQMSDQDAIQSAHMVVNWVCSDVPSIRNTVEAYLAEKYGITERHGPGSSNAFAGAALEAYKGAGTAIYC
ncbi:DUF732 domain-containing protein [Nonomuraea fuscirosea]|uniref:DUF732 domain-containing protein n=1 Tax=Nonomuraea fuscirosea TaxID=1291556 RepID=UPI0033C5F342